MKAIYKKRLLKLADLLLANAKNCKGAKFDLGLVARVEWDRGKNAYPKAEVSCGTVVCAMGLAAVSNAFSKQGVKWRQTNHAYPVETHSRKNLLDVEVMYETRLG